MLQNTRTQLEASESKLRIAMQRTIDRNRAMSGASTSVTTTSIIVSTQELDKVKALLDANRTENATLLSELMVVRIEQDQALKPIEDNRQARVQPESVERPSVTPATTSQPLDFPPMEDPEL